jgi:hypothetical protein
LGFNIFHVVSRLHIFCGYLYLKHTSVAIKVQYTNRVCVLCVCGIDKRVEKKVGKRQTEYKNFCFTAPRTGRGGRERSSS